VSRYRSYGQLDDPFVTEGDTFFLRMNARLRPNQLKPGEVALSKNGRMNEDGTWQPRKGLSTLFGSITTGEASIRVPYIILSASRSQGITTIVLNDTPSLSFIPGDNITIDDVDPSVDGTHTLSTVNFTTKTLTFANAGSDVQAFTLQDESQPNTSVCSADDAIGTTLDFILNDSGVNAVYGSAVYSDASSNSEDYIFSATNNVAVIVRLSDSALFKCRYEGGGETVDGPVDMSQGFDKMFIFRTKKTTLFAAPAINYIAISSASQSGQVITVNTTAAHNKSAGDFVTLTGLGGWINNPNNCYEIKSTPTTTSFTVEMATSQTITAFNVSGAQAEYFDDFTRVTNGNYTAPVYLTDTNTTSSNGVVTMDVVNHGLEVGNEITIRAGASPFDSFVNQKAIVTSTPTADQFTFNLGVEDETSGASLTASRQLAIGKGFIHMPAAPWGEFHQRRLWVPYWYTSATAPQDRNVRDEIAASDILDENTFDRIGNQFRVSSGKSDYLVGLQPFTQDSIVAFNRKSIHLLTGVSGSLTDVKTNVVTSEIGASARKSIVQVANKILFLSDQGIYSVEFLDEYNLRGTGIPISETIQPYIDRINQDYAQLSCGVYFNNRYWLAVPLDSAPGAGNATKLNTLIVYNFINQGFESIDSVDSEDFAIRELLVGREGAQNALYLTTEEGGLHKVDARDGGDVVSLTAGSSDNESLDVISQVITRQYDADQLDRKTFSRGEFHLKSHKDISSDGSIEFITEDPDSVTTSTSISSVLGNNLLSGEDASLRLRINKKGFGVQADFKPTTGRPNLRAVRVDARISDRSTTSIS